MGGGQSVEIFFSRACADHDQWLSVSAKRPFDGVEVILKGALNFKKKAMDLDLELPEGHLPGALFVTAHELAYVVYFAQHFLATGKGPNDYGSGNHEVAQREIGRVYYQILKKKLADCIEDSMVLPFRPVPTLPVAPR